MFYSFKVKFIFSFLLLESIILFLIINLNFNSINQTSQELIQEKNDISSHLFTELIKIPLLTYDIANIEDSIHNFAALKNIIALRVDNQRAITLASYVQESLISKKHFNEMIHKKEYKNNKYIFTKSEIMIDTQKIGDVYFLFDTTTITQYLHYNKINTYILAALALLIGFILSYLLSSWLSKSLQHLIIISQSVSQQKEVKIPYTNSPRNEIETLFLEMHKMQKNISLYTNTLEQFVKALNNSAIVSKTDKYGKIIDVNEKFCEITGYSKLEILGHTHHIIKDPDTDTNFYKEMWQTIAAKKLYKKVFKNIKKNGEAYYVDVTITPMLDENENIKEYISISFEVTEIINAKNRAQEAKKIKEQFLSNMSHEIRTPLNAILGFINLLKKRLHDEQNIKYINTVVSSSTSLLHIINDILDISKIENKKLIIDKHIFNVLFEFKSTVDTFSFKAEEKSILLTLTLDTDLPQYLYGDLLRIKQIIFNFLSNALKFTAENKTINVHILYNKELCTLNISVKDEGIGLSEEEQRKIFLSFEQADNSTTRKFGGTGLGLSISLSLAQLMEGEITLVSAPNKGSTFTLSLPLEVSKKGPKVEKQIRSEELTYKGKVLVAEDNKTNQILIEILLNEYGINPQIVNDGLEAVLAFKNSSFDLILMDENMPNMTGLEALKEIFLYEKTHTLTHTPIVALTANVLQEDKKIFLDAGMDDFLAKPIQTDELERILLKYLKLS